MKLTEALPFVSLCGGLGFTGAALIGFVAPTWMRKRPDPALIVLIAAVSGAVGIFSPGAPTDGRVVDAVFRVAFVVLLTAAGAKARRGPILVAASIVMIAACVGVLRGGSTAASVAVAAASFGGAGGLRLDKTRYRLANVVVTAGIAHAILRLPTALPTYVPSLVGAVAAAVVLIAALSRLRSTGKRRARIGIYGLGGVAVGASFLGIFSLAEARSDVENGVRATKAGLDLGEALDIDGATKSFDGARERLTRASERTGSWLAKPAFAIPVLAQNLRAVHRLSAVGADLSSSASVVFSAANLEKLRPAGGVIDVVAIRNLAKPLGDAEVMIDNASSAIEIVDGPWVLSPIKDRTRPLHAQLAKARKKANSGASAAAVLPAILGADGPRRYLLVVPTPAENRGGGGVLGNFGEIEVDKGKVALSRFDRIFNLMTGGLPWEQRTFTAPADYTTTYAEFTPQRYFNNLLLSPDFPTNAAIIAQQYPQAGGKSIDGVLSMDPYGLAALLEITGPVTVPGWPVPIDSKNAPSVMLNEIYAELAKDPLHQEQRLAVMADVSLQVWQKLTSMSLPSPAKLADALGPLLKHRRIQLWMKAPTEETYIQGIGGAASVPPVVGDSLGLIGQNGGGNKIDFYAHRFVDYTATVLSDGTVDGLVTVRVRNDAPEFGLPKYIIGNLIDDRPVPEGTNVTRLSLYSPLRFTKISYQKRAITMIGGSEFGRNVASGWVGIPSGQERTLTYAVHGKVPMKDGKYRLDLMYQPVVNADTVTLKISTPGGWETPKEGSLLRTEGDSLVGTFELKAYSAVEMRRKA